MSEDSFPRPQAMSASGARAEALQADADSLRRQIAATSDEIAAFGREIRVLGEKIRSLYGNKEEEGQIKQLEADRAMAVTQQEKAEKQQAKLEEQQAKAEAELAKLEAAQAGPPAARGNPNLSPSIYAVLSGDVPIGVAFFVSPTRALTALHNLIPIIETDPLDDSAVFQLASSLEVILKRDDGSTLQVKVVACNKQYDYAVLGSAVPVKHFLTIGPAPDILDLEECILLTWGIGLADELETDPGFTVHQARIMRQSAHHITYDAETFDGDCGGALILTRNCTVIGMHQETVNRARERKRLNLEDKRSDKQRMEDSVDSLIASSSKGAVALRLDAFPFN
ncbi:hypothetical protein BASA81_018242 [Batrachochytrium salamandrivorans]|nr:hypothetical protein BASA81_018242 [Batrachochytrium salamandrivorans]